jgi:hypothetical protein
LALLSRQANNRLWQNSYAICFGPAGNQANEMARIGNRQRVRKKGAAPLNLRQVRLQLGDLTRIKQFNADAKSLPAAHILPARLIASFVIKHVQAPFVLDEMICLKVVC